MRKKFRVTRQREIGCSTHKRNRLTKWRMQLVLIRGNLVGRETY
ncbi:hypothetical protein [Bacteriophage Phi NF-1]|uniref:Uncharacterized protein n=1 Tax=Bacteriophage Phi NF-1 TaxID=2900273 RepID=A0A976MG18_9CAUD|nr:hypothetical protein [Bacteriophage Phi NF-1]